MVAESDVVCAFIGIGIKRFGLGCYFVPLSGQYVLELVVEADPVYRHNPLHVFENHIHLAI
jgi:hypothetical protein